MRGSVCFIISTGHRSSASAMTVWLVSVSYTHLVLALVGCVMNCVYHRLILSTYHIPLDAVDWMGVTFVANAMAYVLPMRADLVFSAAYYKRTKGLAYVKSVSMAAGNIVFGVVFALAQMFVSCLLYTSRCV